jgi:aryl sulfotransferase
LPNILFVHFNDLLNDLDGQMRIIANYLDIEVNETIWPTLVDKATFKTMKANAETVVTGGGDFLIGGAQRFINKGTNGRWKGVLTKEELDMYEETATNQLSQDSKQWLGFGASVLKTNT